MTKAQSDIHEALKLALTFSPRKNGRLDDQRRDPRFVIEPLSAKSYATQAGGTRTEAVVHIVEVGPGGCKVLYPGFLHTDVEIRVSIDLQGQPRTSIIGTVAWCRFVSGRFHAVGIRSDTRINVRPLIEPDEWNAYQEGLADQQAPISGTIVYYCPDPLARSAVRLHLEKTEADLVLATDPGALADVLKRKNADAVLLDIDQDALSPLDLIRSVRDSGCTGPIVLLCSDPETPGLLPFDPLAHTGFVRKPMRTDALTATLHSLIRQRPTASLEGCPIYSEAPPSPMRTEILRDAIGILQDLADRASRQYDQQNYEAVLPPLRSIRSNAGSFGFPALTDASTNCLQKLEDSDGVDWLGADLQRLVSIAARLSPEAPPTDLHDTAA